MRKINVLILLATIFMASCSKNDELNLSSKMTASIDSAKWSSVLPGGGHSDGKFVITGTSLSGESLEITILGNAEGTYVLSLTSAQCAAVYKKTINSSAEDAYVSVTGEVIIDKLDTNSKKISGKFSFSVRHDLVENVITISNGLFTDIKYIELNN
jgi:hypothetical protein